MMHVDFSGSDQASVPFSEITINHKEWRHLLYLQSGTLHASGNEALIRYGLARETRDVRVPGGMPVPTGRIEITDRGRSYLRYRRKEILRAWIPIVISVLSLVVSIAAYFRST